MRKSCNPVAIIMDCKAGFICFIFICFICYVSSRIQDTSFLFYYNRAPLLIPRYQLIFMLSYIACTLILLMIWKITFTLWLCFYKMWGPDHSRVVHHMAHGSTWDTPDHLLAVEYHWCDNIKISLNCNPQSKKLRLLKQNMEYSTISISHITKGQTGKDIFHKTSI